MKLRRESIGNFLADTVRSGRKYDVQQKVQVVLNDEKTANALITKIRHTKKKIQQDHRARAKSFILRKKEQIGRENFKDESNCWFFQKKENTSFSRISCFSFGSKPEIFSRQMSRTFQR